MNKLNRSLEGVIAVSHTRLFDPVYALLEQLLLPIVISNSSHIAFGLSSLISIMSDVLTEPDPV